VKNEWAAPMGGQVGKQADRMIVDQVAEFLEESGRSEAAKELREAYTRLIGVFLAALDWQARRADATSPSDDLIADFKLNQALAGLDKDMAE
jgi:hypothetical protein